VLRAPSPVTEAREPTAGTALAAGTAPPATAATADMDTITGTSRFSRRGRERAGQAHRDASRRDRGHGTPGHPQVHGTALPLDVVRVTASASKVTRRRSYRYNSQPARPQHARKPRPRPAPIICTTLCVRPIQASRMQKATQLASEITPRQILSVA